MDGSSLGIREHGYDFQQHPDETHHEQHIDPHRNGTWVFGALRNKVDIAAWINIFPDSEEPNYGSNVESDDFRFIRLDIGNNLGDILEIYLGGNESAWNWSEGDDIGCSYYSGSLTAQSLNGEEPTAGAAQERS